MEAPPADAAVQWIVEGPLAAAVVAGLPASLAPMTHAALLKAIHRRLDIVPVRFGVLLPDEQAVRERLRTQTEHLLGELTRLQGTGEIGLRIEVQPSLAAPQFTTVTRRDDPAISPSQYLALRRHQYTDVDRRNHEADLASHGYIHAIQGLFREYRTLTSPRPGLIRLAFLVDRGRWDASLARLESFAAETTTTECILLGPWPPYSFVQRTADRQAEGKFTS